MTITTTKRKVLFFIPTFPVLTETFIQGEIVKLSQRGNVEVKVLALESTSNKIHPVIKQNVIVRRLGVLEVLSGFFLILCRLPKFVQSYKLLESLNLPPVKRLYRVVKYFCYTSVIMKINPDIIVSHFMSEPSTLCMIASYVSDIPFGISAHARDITVDAECVKQKSERAKFVLVCNKNAMNHLIKLNGGIRPDSYIIQYHGVEVSEFGKIEGDANLKSERPVIVDVGRLVEKKGHPFLIEASKVLKERGVDHLVYIIGPGEMYGELTRLINKLGVEDNVKILGDGAGLPPAETYRYVKSAMMGVFPGIKTDWGDEDGVPNALLEYAAMKIPVVSTDAGSSSDFIENEVTGLLVSQKNSHELADKIEMLIFNKQLADKITAGAFKKVSEEFDISKNIVNLEKLLL